MPYIHRLIDQPPLNHNRQKLISCHCTSGSFQEKKSGPFLVWYFIPGPISCPGTLTHCLLDFWKIVFFKKRTEPPGKKTGSTEEGSETGSRPRSWYWKRKQFNNLVSCSSSQVVSITPPALAEVPSPTDPGQPIWPIPTQSPTSTVCSPWLGWLWYFSLLGQDTFSSKRPSIIRGITPAWRGAVQNMVNSLAQNIVKYQNSITAPASSSSCPPIMV